MNIKETKLYTAVWRWHFYAGLLVVPICILLGITGGIYLFKPQLEPIIYRDMWKVEAGATKLPATQQVAAVQAHRPEAIITTYYPSFNETDASQFSIKEDGISSYLFVDPYTAEVTGEIERNEMFMEKIRTLHGELMLGDAGTLTVELVAGWAIILLITGIYLWWPRPFKIAGAFTIRRNQGKRIFWRDLHAVLAMYASGMILAILISGLPWTNVAGNGIDAVRSATGQKTPLAAAFAGSFAFKSTPVEGATPLNVDDIIAMADEKGFPDGYSVQLISQPDSAYALKYDKKLKDSQYLYIDQYSGQAIGEATWDDYPLIAKTVTSGIRFHQGELFGVANLLLGLFAAVSIVLMSFSGVVMWWKRKPSSGLGAPKKSAVPALNLYDILLLGVILATFVPALLEWKKGSPMEAVVDFYTQSSFRIPNLFWVLAVGLILVTISSIGTRVTNKEVEKLGNLKASYGGIVALLTLVLGVLLPVTGISIVVLYLLDKLIFSRFSSI